MEGGVEFLEMVHGEVGLLGGERVILVDFQGIDDEIQRFFKLKILFFRWKILVFRVGRLCLLRFLDELCFAGQADKGVELDFEQFWKKDLNIDDGLKAGTADVHFFKREQR